MTKTLKKCKRRVVPPNPQEIELKRLKKVPEIVFNKSGIAKCQIIGNVPTPRSPCGLEWIKYSKVTVPQTHVMKPVTKAVTMKLITRIDRDQEQPREGEATDTAPRPLVEQVLILIIYSTPNQIGPTNHHTGQGEQNPEPGPSKQHKHYNSGHRPT